MKDDKPQDHGPTAGEQLGGIIGCVALLLAVLLLAWLSWRGFAGSVLHR